MLKLLDRTAHALGDRLVLLAPDSSVVEKFHNANIDARRHGQLVREMQALRGSVYLHDGAIRRDQLSADGLHETAEDNRSWHLLTVDKDQRVTGCAWYLEHDGSISVDHLRVRHTPLARSGWRQKLWTGVEAELRRARHAGLRYVEVGGWAVAPESRCTSEGLVLALAGYSLGRIRGGCLGITTATTRHCSSSILRRLGGSPLASGESVVPRYFDPRYDCEMEILRFDSRYPGRKYSGLIDLLQEKMRDIHVIAPAMSTSNASRNLVLGGMWNNTWTQPSLTQSVFAQ